MATENPKRFPRVPYAHLRWLVDRRHVATAESVVAAEVVKRMAKARATDEEIKEAVRYALDRHADNGELCVSVSVDRGSF